VKRKNTPCGKTAERLVLNIVINILPTELYNSREFTERNSRLLDSKEPPLITNAFRDLNTQAEN